MKVLLDTHAFIWWDSDPSLLSSTALAVCRDPANTLLLSVASVWEMQIKSQLSKLNLGLALRDIVEAQQQNGLLLLEIRLEHVLAVDALPMPHKDPFDRILAAQAIAEGAVLLTADAIFGQYPVNVVW